MGLEVKLFTKVDCHLCHQARALLERLSQEFPLEIHEVDITRDPQAYSKYKDLIPVVVLKGVEFPAPKLSEFRLRRLLEKQ